MKVIIFIAIFHELLFGVDLRTLSMVNRSETVTDRINDSNRTLLPGATLGQTVEWSDCPYDGTNEKCSPTTTANNSKEMNENRLPTSRWPYTFTSCKQKDFYPSLQSCKNECIFIHLYNNTNYYNKFNVNDVNYQHIAYKLEVFQKNEFVITNNMLIIKGQNTDEGLGQNRFSEEYYFLYNNTAFLCLPLHKCFERGRDSTTIHYPHEYDEHSRRLWLTNEKLYLEMDEFYFEFKVARACDFDKTTNKILETITTMHEFGYIVSAVFLAITLVIVYFTDGMKKRYNRPLHCFIVMLFFSFVTASIKVYVPFESRVCEINGFFLQYFFLSAFFWINSQAIDLYLSLKNMHPNPDASQKKKKRFIAYCFYSWGIPACITGMTMIANFHRFEGMLDIDFYENCWFQRTNIIGAFIFHYGWIAATLLINAILFILILKRFQLIGKAVLVANTNIYKQLISISIKLVILLGFCWIVKLVVWTNAKPNWKVNIVDAIVTSFYGIFVFIIYSWKLKNFPLCCCARIRRRSFNGGSRVSSVKSSIISTMSLKMFASQHIHRNPQCKSNSSSGEEK